MSYTRKEEGGLVTLHIACDANQGNGTCPNHSAVAMYDEKAAKALLFHMGWRLLRGRQVCVVHARAKRVSFSRTPR